MLRTGKAKNSALKDGKFPTKEVHEQICIVKANRRNSITAIAQIRSQFKKKVGKRHAIYGKQVIRMWSFMPP